MKLISKGMYGDYHVLHTEEFEIACTAAGAEYHRFQSVWQSLRRTIVTDPSQEGKVLPKSDGVVSFSGDEEYMLPKMVIRYRYAGVKIAMIDMKCCDQDK